MEAGLVSSSLSKLRGEDGQGQYKWWSRDHMPEAYVRGPNTRTDLKQVLSLQIGPNQHSAPIGTSVS